MNRNNLAYAVLMAQADGPDLLRARELAEAAFAAMPWEAGIEGTLGAALVETSAVEAGLRHLEAAGKQYDSPHSQASNLAWRAWGHHRLGQSEQAQALLGEAARLDGAHPGVQRIMQRCRAEQPCQTYTEQLSRSLVVRFTASAPLPGTAAAGWLRSSQRH